MRSQAEKVESFHALHAEGCFVMPNPWDAGTAVALAKLGFKALATTSAGHAWSAARPDNGVFRNEALDPCA
jgi:PEP phosphonomutase and related enzymes